MCDQKDFFQFLRVTLKHFWLVCLFFDNKNSLLIQCTANWVQKILVCWPTSALALLCLTSLVCWANIGHQKCWNNLRHLFVSWSCNKLKHNLAWLFWGSVQFSVFMYLSLRDAVVSVIVLCIKRISDTYELHWERNYFFQNTWFCM